MIAMSNQRICVLIIALAGMAVASPAAALDEVPEYHVTQLGPMIEQAFPGVQYPSSTSRGINENGDVVGEAQLNGSRMHAWVYTYEHGVVALPLIAGFTSSIALDVSDRDANGEILIVGGGTPSLYWDLAIGEAALWRFSTVTGQVLEARAIGILPGFEDSIAVAVNNAGNVVGYCGLIGPFSPLKYNVHTDLLEPLDFPVRPAALNNLDQIVGGRYRGDLNGNYVDLGLPPDCTSSTLVGINDLGWVSGGAGRPFTDGAGRFMASVTRYTETGWHVLPAISPWDRGFDINIHGDVTAGIGPGWNSYLYIAALNMYQSVAVFLPIQYYGELEPHYTYAINDNGQLAGRSGHAFVLTPLGVMVIPGDVNGDVQVNLDDHCAWVDNPIDLNGDEMVNAEDEQWLIDRLAALGLAVTDCNGNGVGDHCDIIDATSADCDANDVPDECQADCSGDGYPDVCEPDCNENGNPDPCDILEQLSMDCNFNGVPDECDGGRVVGVHKVLDPPIELWESIEVLESTLFVDAGTIADVDFTLHVDYRIGDLTILLSHEGTTITVLDRPGYPDNFLGNGQLGYDIVVDDEGAGDFLENVGNFGSPFEPIESPPSYKPDEPLSTFDGLPSEGIWTIHVVTSDSWSPTDALFDWGLIVTIASEAVGGDYDLQDYTVFFDCLTGPDTPPQDGCECFDLDGDNNIDVVDYGILQAGFGS